jgi:hypothetical protein
MKRPNLTPMEAIEYNKEVALDLRRLNQKRKDIDDQIKRLQEESHRLWAQEGDIEGKRYAVYGKLKESAHFHLGYDEPLVIDGGTDVQIYDWSVDAMGTPYFLIRINGIDTFLTIVDTMVEQLVAMGGDEEE